MPDTAAPEPADTASLASAWKAAKSATPKARARDIADRLGVSEGALAEARIGDGVARLALGETRPLDLLEGMRGIGPVMTLTRNEACVHEVTGEMGEVAGHGMMGQVVGAIDLRLFLRHWHAAYSMSEETRSGLRQSVQVFDKAGESVIKIYATAETDMPAWQALAETHWDTGTSPTSFTPAEAPAADPPDDQIDTEALRNAWRALEHSHDFHKVLREMGLGRSQALRLAGPDLARQVPASAVETLLRGAAAGEIPIMCFVGNPGCIQIYSGQIERIEPMGPWLNILDPSFNLHLRADRVAEAWAVIKPTKLRGQITSLELYDAEKTLICQFFGARPPGEGERLEWRSLVENLPGRHP
ncbi:MAG: ChuX/HutX family heme-like substrate-binding protein [Pseudomonadota bacterium]